MNNDVTIIECTSPAELYRQYDNENEAQPVYIELDLRDGTLLADYDSVIGSVSFTVYHGFERRYSIPLVTGEAANRVMREIAPLAERMLADWEEVWDGNNMKAVLGEDAIAAEEEIEALLGAGYTFTEAAFGPKDELAVWDVADATNGCEAKKWQITAETSDERLAEIEREMLTLLAGCGDSSAAVCPGLYQYLEQVREEQRQHTQVDA